MKANEEQLCVRNDTVLWTSKEARLWWSYTGGGYMGVVQENYLWWRSLVPAFRSNWLNCVAHPCKVTAGKLSLPCYGSWGWGNGVNVKVMCFILVTFRFGEDSFVICLYVCWDHPPLFHSEYKLMFFLKVCKALYLLLVWNQTICFATLMFSWLSQFSSKESKFKCIVFIFNRKCLDQH